MGSIKDKSDYFLVSKNLLQNVLQVAGADITETTPFREYHIKVQNFTAGITLGEDFAIMKILDILDLNTVSNTAYEEAYTNFQYWANIHKNGG